MKPITIIHHLGLGDQIMLNGMVRHFAEVRKVNIFVKNCHEESVRFMYRDIEHKVNLILLDTTEPGEIREKLPIDSHILPLATYAMENESWHIYAKMTNWAHGVYLQAGVNPLYMHTKFKVVRTITSELEPPVRDYIFVHDDVERDRVINVTSDLTIYRPKTKVIDKNHEFFECEHPNIFKYLSIIENAKEVHCMNSSYNWMIELMTIGTPRKNFFHLGVAHLYYDDDLVKSVFTDRVWTFVQ